MIIDKIKKTISAYGLIRDGDKVLVGLSGGADSVCLTHALFSLKDELDFTLYTAHVNHGIRGNEAIRDEEFAKAFSRSLGIECFTVSANIPQLAKDKGISEETAGRQVRYDFFNELCAKNSIDKIATAHNRNDNAETILMNFMRGTGIKGLGGIPYRRGNIIRPLLDVTRNEIERYCEKHCLDYMTDSTNNELVYTRNKIRHTLIPLIQNEFNMNFVDTVSANAVLIKDDSSYIEKKADEAYAAHVKDGMVSIEALLTLDIPIRRRVIRAMIRDARMSLEDIPLIYVNDVLTLLTKNSGASVNLSDGIVARIEYGKLIISSKTELTPPFEYTFDCGTSGVISEISMEIIISQTEERKKDGAIYISCDEGSKITVRSRREGDLFYPCGMTGSKKVKELFINKKIPRAERARIPIIEIDGKIAAVGSRIDRRFLFTDRGIRIEFKPFQEVGF